MAASGITSNLQRVEIVMSDPVDPASKDLPPPDAEASSNARLIGEAVLGTERFPTLAQDTLYVRIADHVRKLIETHQLQPGERLPAERELSEMLGVSRVPIREAMRTLAAQGLIEVRRGHGMFVTARAIDATIDQLTSALIQQRAAFRELFAVRRLLEPVAAEWAASGAQPNDANLERIIDEMAAAVNSKPVDFNAIGERDAELHVQIAAASGNNVLLRIMQAIQDLHREQLETSLRYAGRLDETIADHRRIVRAIQVRDPGEARAAMLDHLDNSETATLSRIEGNPTDATAPEPGTLDG
jgi:GntR family transcriptional regulator, transcriptional repressor for pyruvate dehydrogenase complex